MPSTTSQLFPPGIGSEHIVKMTLVVLQANYQREADRIAEAIAGIDQVYIDKLSALWEELLSRTKDPGTALSTFTKIVAAELDGGDSPGLPGPDLHLVDN